MTEWSEERRVEVAAEFRKVGGDWHESGGLTDPVGPLWRECLSCHRMRTIEKMADPDDAALWRCGKCGCGPRPRRPGSVALRHAGAGQSALLPRERGRAGAARRDS